MRAPAALLMKRSPNDLNRPQREPDYPEARAGNSRFPEPRMKGFMKKCLASLVCSSLAILCLGVAIAADPTLPPGTIITMQNWSQFQQFMPDGMIVLFQGKSSWKMPDDVQMEVGPTVIHPLPEGYLAATEKYSPSVKVVELPDGGLNLTGYQGGIPFPKPDEPHKGWKILANFWLRYMPHIVVNTPDNMGFNCTLDSFGNVNCAKGLWVARQLAYNTDPGVPVNVPGSEGKYYATWFMINEPEQQKYTTTLTIEYTDLTKPEDVFNFSPSMRRTLRLSAAGRCSSAGSEITPDD